MLKRLKKRTILKEEIWYLFFWICMLFSKGIGLYDGQALYKAFFAVAFGCIVVKICITEYTAKEWIFLIGLGTLIMAVYFASKEKGILICGAIILGMKNISVEKVFKIGAWVWSITMSANIFYHLIFLHTSGYKVHEKLGLGHIFRWDLGFSHPNVLHIAYLTLTAFLVYNLGKKYNWKYMLLLMLGNLFVFLYSVSYTGVTVVTIYLLLSLYMNIRKELSIFEYILIELVFPATVILSLFSPIILPSKIFNILNKVFNTRLSLAKFFLTEENIKALGNNLENLTTYQLTMDNSYIFSLIIYGVVVFLLLCAGYLYSIHYCVKRKMNRELAMFVSFVIAGITEPFMFNTSFKNLTLIFVGSILWEKMKSDVTGKKALLPIKVKSIEFSCIDNCSLKNYIKEIWQKKKKSIIRLSCIMGLTAGIMMGILWQMPKGYVVPRKHVTMESKETWYLESEDDERFAGYVILDYENSETKMQHFEGNIVKIEMMRKCISLSIFVAFISGIGYTFIKAVKMLKKGSPKERE